MDLMVLNNSFEKLGIIDESSSIIWHRKYNTAGNFQITLPASKNNISLIAKNNIIHKPGADEAGVIDTFYIKDDDGAETIEASGYFLTGLLQRRVIPKQTTFNDTYRNIMHTLVNSNAAGNATAKRKITGLQMPTLEADTAEKVRLQVTGKNLLDYLEGLSLVSAVGFKVLYKRSYMEFNTYIGLDKSINQNANPRIVFSEEYDNLTASEYTYSDTGKVTAAYVAGEGEGTARKIIEVDNGGTGWNRFEYFVDDRSSREDGMTDAQYLELLKSKGLEVQQPAAENFSGTIIDSGTAVYKKDWDLGDIVTVFNKKWGKKISVRITEVEEVDDESGSKIIIYVGTTEKTIIDILKE